MVTSTRLLFTGNTRYLKNPFIKKKTYAIHCMAKLRLQKLNSTDLLRSLCELFDIELFVKVRFDQKVVYSSAQPDERIWDPNNYHFLVLFQTIPVRGIRTGRCYHRRRRG